MANIVTMTINDGAATPKPHVFTPNQGEAGKVRYVELSTSGSLKARPTLEIVVKPLGTNGRTTQEVHGTIAFPIVVQEEINGVTVDKIIGTDYAHFRFTESAQSSAVTRKNQRVMLKNLLDQATLVALVDNAESFVSAS